MKLKMILLLTCVCAVSAFLLAWVYGITDPKIKQDIAKKTNIYLMKVVFPEGKEYKLSDKDTTLWVACDSAGKIVGSAQFELTIPETLWTVFDTTHNKIGIAFKVWPKGYGGAIETLVGLGMDTILTGIRTVTPAEGLKETPGLGIKVTALWFKHQFIGKKEHDISLKKDGGVLDAITAATISSRAVARGVQKGILKYKEYLNGQATKLPSD